MATTTTTVTRTITAENVLTLFPDVDTGLANATFPTTAGSSARDGADMEGYDEEQIRLMDEVCIVVDDNDSPIGSASKKTCLSLYHPSTGPQLPLNSVPILSNYLLDAVADSN